METVLRKEGVRLKAQGVGQKEDGILEEWNDGQDQNTEYSRQNTEHEEWNDGKRANNVKCQREKERIQNTAVRIQQSEYRT